MAKKGRGSRLHVAKIDKTMALGALAADTLISSLLGDTVVTKEYAVSLDCVYTFEGATVGEGPIMFGWAHSDYSSTEIEEALEATGSWDVSDKVSQEQARRLVRTVGTMDLHATTEKFREGQVVRTKLKFNVEEGKTLRLWAYNCNTGAALTAGIDFRAQGNIYLVPK